MENIIETLKKLALPETELSEVTTAVQTMLEQAKSDLEKEFNTKLEEAYAELSNELAESEKKANAGYEEAYAIISDLRNRLELQGEEYKAAMSEGYEEAYQMLKTEQEKNAKLEVEMYEEYDKKLAQMREYIVDKVDQFLQFKGNEIYEQAKRDVLNDPRMAEHKVALDRIVNITSNYMSEDDFNTVNSAKIEEATKAVEDMRGQLRILEARNIRLSTDNSKLNESLRQAAEQITESKKTVTEHKKSETVNEQKARTEKVKEVTGRGHLSSDKKLIAEHTAEETSDDLTLILAGLKRSN